MRYIIREKFFRLGEDSTITDESGRPVIQVDGKVFSLHQTLVLRDLMGNELATVKKQLLALGHTYHITRQGQEAARVHKKIISPFVDRFTVDIPGGEELHVTGSIFEHNFTIKQGEQVVATVSKRWISLTDTYGVETAPGQDDLLLLATVLAIDLAEDEERAQRREQH
jgi:uncharacterized protein YxjI